MDSPTVLAIQSWTLYAIAISLIFSRIIFRRMALGTFKSLQADDWLVIVTLVPFTTSIVLANLISDDTFARQRQYRYILEEMQIITVWLVKACLLVLYWRIFPVESSSWKRFTIKGVTAFCAASYLIIQFSLIGLCSPVEDRWNLHTTNSECTTYHTYSALTLAFSATSTFLVFVFAVPFIPTPRRALLAILFIIGSLVLGTGIVSRASLFSHSQHHRPTYLYYFTAETTLSIIFANLPFLTSLVVATAPSRIRNLRTSHLALNQWPRSRRGSWEISEVGEPVPLTPPTVRMARAGSTITLSETASPIDSKSMVDWKHGIETRGSRSGSARSESLRDARGSVLLPEPLTPTATAQLASGTITPTAPAPSTAPLLPTADRFSNIPKMRLSGGLAEMGSATPTESPANWPIHWR